MALTKEQKSKVRLAIEAKAEKQTRGLRDQMQHEAKRDALAYEILKKEPNTPWADLQARAEEELSKSPKPKGQGPKSKPAPAEEPAIPPQVG